MRRPWTPCGVLQRMLQTVVLGATLVVTANLAAAQQATVAPQEVGIDPVRLARLTDFVQSAVKNGSIPGAVLYVWRHGKVVIDRAFGVRDPATGAPMTTDALFRIYSMTKPLTATAALRMAEQGKISLSQPVSDFLPAFAHMTVLDERRIPGIVDPVLTRPAQRPLSLYDLIRHAGGFGDETFYPGYVGQQFRAQGIGTQALTLEQAVDKVSAIPLLYEPGTHFSYAETNFTVLGRVLEVADKKPIAEALRDEVFRPLGMTDTGFWVDPSEADRVAHPFPGHDAAESFNPVGPRTYLSTANGLVSTAADYARWAEMIVNDGRDAKGNAFLAPLTVDNMTTDAISGLKPGYVYFFDSFAQGYSWGLGVGVSLPGVPSPSLTGPGTVFWVGALGTTFLADRDLGLVVVLMTQDANYVLDHLTQFQTLAVQSVTGP